ncbi:cold-shock protein [Azospirillum sp.]|uniref:cold-shock protein n=1 Tax=Azospirillum sp. TaxID=34012 RepID=UPI002D375947|nr:cold shock domain-containing protein [Azospirillum sp.]HYD68984.1 cold shock domain-containing protein [Azospirillum sp.]
MDQKNVTASVKWFKADKGYGFVRFGDGTGEAFLHSSVLAPIGLSALADGATILCDVTAGAKGPQVSAVHRVEDAPPAEPPPARSRRKKAAGTAREGVARDGVPRDGVPAEPRPPRGQPAPAAEPAAGELMAGSIRWYNLDSQSGLIDPADGGESIYFDRATLRQSRIEIVADGEDVWFSARDTADGPVADRVELAPRRAD